MADLISCAYLRAVMQHTREQYGWNSSLRLPTQWMSDTYRGVLPAFVLTRPARSIASSSNEVTTSGRRP